MAVSLPLASAKTGVVVFDTCEPTTGDMIEAKGPGNWKVLEAANRYGFSAGPNKKLLDQGLNQVLSAKSRRVRWYFAEPKAAKYTRDLFVKEDLGRERIQIVSWAGN